MKNAYISIVLPWRADSTYEMLVTIDTALSRTTQAHEIVVVSRFADRLDDGSFADAIKAVRGGPVSMVNVWHGTTPDMAMIAGMSRAVGDFVITWDHGDPAAITDDIIEELLSHTDHGAEVVDLSPARSPLISRIFYRIANAFRPPAIRLRPAVARVHSRRALSALLGAVGSDASITVLAAELPLPRSRVLRDISRAPDTSYLGRVGEGLSIVSRGSRFGTALPLAAAMTFATLAAGAAVFAGVVYVVRGQTPEGWTTLMVLTSLGLAAILSLLGLIWHRLSVLTAALGGSNDATSSVVVVPPKAFIDPQPDEAQRPPGSADGERR